ncbi:MAG: flavin prenyltransferase UbiX [Pseudomonadales bacterium]|jgi:4-hydroxy-3-polyprenylbenzoate decarboxylase|nr:flavin prenyltransferase UbiX [Pseudomonadales bacterium]MDP7356917.1 flavin prenyltransferase UbiX [Pseudomonadales bacterium]MDP7595985.1 flavin prenyltransferase UbiX [Pseudomonadales bacterium]HJN52761.1 flavin prenyltransferase UbiX [Pseudomonadales bacterium]|tara:strand:+ start:210 stop:836 length:627 start_codon:yes stop_codon:yes gene_type:complete
MHIMSNESAQAVTLALTGASGAPYGLRLLQMLLHAGKRVYLMMSEAAQIVLPLEADISLPTEQSEQQRFLQNRFQADEQQLHLLGLKEWTSPVASGLGAPKSMIICPCSTGTLSAIATGASTNLIQRAADVAIKESNQLILVPRETPLSAIHLGHMLTLSRLGVTILPASPGFYHQPKGIDDLIDFVVARILSQLGVDQSLIAPWGDS